jgi:hypothetical protein
VNILLSKGVSSMISRDVLLAVSTQAEQSAGAASRTLHAVQQEGPGAADEST